MVENRRPHGTQRDTILGPLKVAASWPREFPVSVWGDWHSKNRGGRRSFRERMTYALVGKAVACGLSRAAEYAVHALVFLAQRNAGEKATSASIAQARSLPEAFLRKVLMLLTSARILSSVCGQSGGFILARAPSAITLLEIVEAVDGPIQGPVSFSSDAIEDTLDKQLDAICDQAAEQVRRQFQKVRLSELAKRDLS
jgi:Rrf2 family protein